MSPSLPSHARWLPCNMAQHAGVTLAPGDPGDEIAEVCAQCTKLYACLDWLVEAPADAPPPGFCLNAERIEALAVGR